MSIPMTEITMNNDVKIYLTFFLITFLFLITANKINGIATALPNKNDSGLIKKLTTYAMEIRIKKKFTLPSKICLDKKISVEKLKITAAAVQVGLGTNQSKCKKDKTKQTATANKLFDLNANNPNKCQLRRVNPSKIIENQFMLGINS